LKIGVVCEGPTDFPSIKAFVGSCLAARGVTAEFRQLFPDRDKTRQVGGWGNVLNWTRKYPPPIRVQQFFGGGLFGANLSSDVLDAIIFHLDTDVLDDPAFQKFVLTELDVTVVSKNVPAERASQIVSVLEAALGLSSLTARDRARHVIAPAVEATETWCVAAFYPGLCNAENLRGSSLINKFMIALEKSESRNPEANYQTCSKDLLRRERFCDTHSVNHQRIYDSCSHFRHIIQSLLDQQLQILDRTFDI